jgi:hypothetical protein
MELNGGNTHRAVELLQATSVYEHGAPRPFQFGTLYPIYVRGRAYLRAGQGQQTAIEFQKMIDYRGVTNSPGRAGPSPAGTSLCLVGRHRESAHQLPGLLRPLERRRPRHSHPQRSQSGVREVAVAGQTTYAQGATGSRDTTAQCKVPSYLGQAAFQLKAARRRSCGTQLR